MGLQCTKPKSLLPYLDAVENSQDRAQVGSTKAQASDDFSQSSWIATLAKDVFEHEHGLIIHGVSLEGNNDQTKKAFIKQFCKDELKASEELVNKVRIKDVCRLGSGSASGRLPPSY